MKYLISHQIKVLANCLENYKEVWDIVPIMMRISFENPKLSMKEIQVKSKMENYGNLFSRIMADLKTAQEKNIVFKRPHKVFKQADDLLVLFNKLTGKKETTSESSENELLDIVNILSENVKPLSKRPKWEIENLKVMDDIDALMKKFPFTIQTVLQRSIKRKEEIEQELGKGVTAKREIKVYLDMDSCITDCDKAIRKLGPKVAKGLADDASEEEKQYMYDKIEEKGAEFWSEMEWMPKGEELWKVVKKYDPVLLSSPGLFKWAPGGKKNWVDKNIPGTTLYLDIDKYQWAEPDSVLIDDRVSNIESWKEAGGEAILYENDPELVKLKLKEIISQPG